VAGVLVGGVGEVLELRELDGPSGGILEAVSAVSVGTSQPPRLVNKTVAVWALEVWTHALQNHDLAEVCLLGDGVLGESLFQLLVVFAEPKTEKNNTKTIHVKSAALTTQECME